MRDVILVGFLLAVAPFAVVLPQLGVMLWAWFAFMTPHRETFGFAYDLEFNLWIAVGTAVAWVLSRERSPIFTDAVPIVMLVFLAWTGITTMAAVDFDHSWWHFDRTYKTFFLGFAVLGLITTKTRIQAMCWTICVALGYYIAKGAGFFAFTGGSARIYGPLDSMIWDNNNFALAVIVTIPLLNYLRRSSALWVTSLAVAAVMAMSYLTVVGTYSRGGLVGLAVVSLGMWVRSRSRLIPLLLVAVGVLMGPSVLPPEWGARMSTIPVFFEDESFVGRQEAWDVAIGLAADRPVFGGGFSATELDQVFDRYNDGITRQGTAAHSVYFQVLGDHGYTGLFLYLLLMAFSWANLQQVRAWSVVRPRLQWAVHLAEGMQISLVGFAVTGALLSMAYYDLYVLLIALSSVLRTVVSNELKREREGQAPGPAWEREANAGTAQNGSF